MNAFSRWSVVTSIWVSALALTQLPVLVAQAETTAPAYRVIVHVSNPATHLSRELTADLFLKKRTRWSHGSSVKPVDQSSASAVRTAFSDSVLKRSVAAVRSYWQQLVFAGRELPPPELDSDAAVLAYVAKHEGAIGYVTGSANVATVKVVQLK